MAVQGGNTINHESLHAGMLVDGQLNNSVSGVNSGTETIPAGLGVIRDGEDGIKLPLSTSAAKDFLGVVKYELNRATIDGVAGAVVDKDATIITTGSIAVPVIATAAVTNDVYLVVADGVNKGKFAVAAGSGVTAAVKLENARFVRGAAAGKLAVIEINLR